jgi:hypothetical protein
LDRTTTLQLAHRPACFGLSLAAEKKERFFYCYGQPVLADLSIKRFRNSSARSFRPKPTARNGLSLAYDDCSLPNHRRRVKAPGLPLRYHATPVIDPFGHELLSSLCRAGTLNAHNPLPTSKSDAFNSTIEFALPFGAFIPLRIVALIRFELKGLPSRFARLSFAPREGGIL